MLPADAVPGLRAPLARSAASEPETLFLPIGSFELHVRLWGPADAQCVVLSHGLARSGADFDVLADRLATRWRVVAIDMIGRGLSSWSPEPERDYALDRYAALSVAALRALGVRSASWVGTSMGGTIGIRIAGDASLGEAFRIERLLLNDTGPVRAPAELKRIAAAVGRPPVERTLAAIEPWFRRVYAGSGERSDAAWRALVARSVRRTDDGRYTPQHDPRIALQFETQPQDFDLWTLYEAIAVPTLCLRGVHSELLTTDTAAAMRARGPRAVVVEVDGCGHAPGLDVPEQIALVEDFLDPMMSTRETP